MCDYDVVICKILVYAIAILGTYFFLDYVIVKRPLQLEEYSQMQQMVLSEKERDFQRLERIFSNININANVNADVSGYMDSRVKISGHLFEPTGNGDYESY